VVIIRNLFQLARGDPRLEAGADLRLAHLFPAQLIHLERPFVHNSLTLEALISGKGDGFAHLLTALLSGRSCPCSFLRFRASATTRAVWLPNSSAICRCAARTRSGRQDDLLIAGMVRCNLRGLRSGKATAHGMQLTRIILLILVPRRLTIRRGVSHKRFSWRQR
jgi:hypothetical protein